MTWVILGHTYYYALNQSDNLTYVFDAFTRPFLQIIGNAVLAVDTFYCIGGFLTSFILLKKFKKVSSPAFVAKLYLHRYLRLTMVYGIVIIFFMGFLGRYGHGTFVHFTSDPLVERCKQYWWRNILYISNLIQVCDETGYCRVKSCLGHSWYLSNDMQFFVVGVPLILMVSKTRYVGVVVWVLILLANIGLQKLPFLVTQFIFRCDRMVINFQGCNCSPITVCYS